MKRRKRLLSGALILLCFAFILASCSSDRKGSGWRHPSDLSDNISPDDSSAGNLRVAMDNNGNAIVVWQQYDGSNSQIFMSEYRNGSWKHPSDLSDNISPDGSNAWPSQVAMDNNGNAIVLWQQDDGSNYQIFMSEYRNGSWVHPSDLSDNISPDGQDASLAQVAMDNNGNAIVVWEQWNGSNYQIYMSEYRNGSWKHPSDLSDNISLDGSSVDWAQVAQVAMDNNGNAIVLWEQYDGSNNQIFMSEYRNGSWKHPSDLSDNISLDGSSVDWAQVAQVAMDNNGNAIVLWEQYDGSNNQIFMSEYRNGSWKHPSDLSDNISPDGSSAWPSQVAMDNNGNAIVLWEQDDGSNNRQIFMSEYRNGSWVHPSDLSDNISLDGKDAIVIKVAMDNNGNAIVIWRQEEVVVYSSKKQIFMGPPDYYCQIFMSEYRNSTWVHPSDLSDNISLDGSSACTARVAMDNNGNTIIVWRQNDGSNYGQIFMSEYR